MSRVLLICLVAGNSACSSFSYREGRSSASYHGRATLKPLVAVSDFENLSGFSGKWNLGEGMADLLVVELMDSGRVVVLERKHLDDVVGEIVRQGKDLFRAEGKVERGRLKNAKFLVRGSVTDFTVTGDSSGWFSASNFRVFGRGSRARVAVTVKVSDVETGEIISSVKTDSSVSGGGFGAAVNYQSVAFGGDSYFRTPLGRATEQALKKAIRLILRDLPALRWQPRVAEAQTDLVIINGGKNVRLREGQVFSVRDSGREITDPATGNVVETVPGRVIGRVQVKQVRETSAHAVILEGTARRGNSLEPVETRK